jgi:hypothetical protein
MTDFIVTITDADQLAGIAWAREQHNASLPPAAPPMTEVPPEDYIDHTLPDALPEEPLPPEGWLETDEQYVQWVMEQAAINYAVQQEQATWRQAYEDAQTESKRKREAARATEADPADRAEEVQDA